MSFFVSSHITIACRSGVTGLYSRGGYTGDQGRKSSISRRWGIGLDDMLFIGDVHGKISEYQKRIHGTDRSIQVGDFGIGFISEKLTKSINKDTGHRFIRGNHDDPSLCKQLANYVPDGTYWSEEQIFFVGGALSVDKAYRIEGVSWWPGEELTQKELTSILDLYHEVKPEIMVSHDCPETPARRILNRVKLAQPSITRQALQAMWEAYQPRYWIFGHYHVFYREKLNSTEFIGLNELETLIL